MNLNNDDTSRASFFLGGGGEEPIENHEAKTANKVLEWSYWHAGECVSELDSRAGQSRRGERCRLICCGMI